MPGLPGWGRTRVGAALAFGLAVAWGGVGCAWFRATPTPMASTTFHPGRSDATTYAMLLPGRGDVPQDYARAGFPQRLIEAGFVGEIVGVDAHLQYYLRGMAIARVHADVVQPRAGRAPWLVGISMGGLGALLYEKEHPGTATGLVLLAPFLGDPALVREIERAGGLAAWEPGPIVPGDYQRDLWAWIKAGGLDRVPVFLAWGRSDRFAPANRLLAAELPPERVVEIPGDHTWRTWQPAFDALLARGACGVSIPPVLSNPGAAARR